MIDCDFAGAAVVDCTFESASLSVLTTFSRCSFRWSIPVIGVAKISGSTHDGTTILDRWIDEEDAEDATERYLERYITAATAGEQDEMPLDP